MNLYRVAYIMRTNPTASIQEKVAFVVAENEAQAAEHINKNQDHEAQSVSTATSNVQIATNSVPAVIPRTPEPEIFRGGKASR